MEIKTIVMTTDMIGQNVDDYFKVDSEFEMLIKNFKMKLARDGFDLMGDNFLGIGNEKKFANNIYKEVMSKHILVFAKNDKEIK